jgi:ribosomal protein S18 acetylase RimI-like enzyme
MDLTFVDLRGMMGEPEVRRVLAFAIGYPTPEKVGRVCQDYRSKAGREILGAVEDGAVVGCIGLDLSRGLEIEILHIAVDPEHRRRGIGRWMLEKIRDRYPLCSVVAETDADAVEFYRRCGFGVESLGRGQWGVERFRCRWGTRAH